jgi:hypothetical protein
VPNPNPDEIQNCPEEGMVGSATGMCYMRLCRGHAAQPDSESMSHLQQCREGTSDRDKAKVCKKNSGECQDVHIHCTGSKGGWYSQQTM